MKNIATKMEFYNDIFINIREEIIGDRSLNTVFMKLSICCVHRFDFSLNLIYEWVQSSVVLWISKHFFNVTL